MKTYKWIQGSIFVVLGILIIAFYSSLIDVAGYVVGATMILFALDDLLIMVVSSNYKHLPSKLINMGVLVILGSCLIVLNKDIGSNFTSICVLWATWSILRESEELKEVFHLRKLGKPYILNGIESFTLIVLSIIFIFKPRESVNFHMVLVGIELILEVVFPLVNTLYLKEKKN